MTATELENYGSALPSLSSPIAENGDKRAPIAGSNNQTDTQASVKFGLPSLMSEPISENGIPVPRQDLNGMYNLLSKIVHYLMAGGRIPYSASESSAIGGYPQGAEVSYQGHNYKSLVDSNTVVPTDTTKWKCIDYLPLAGGMMTGAILSNFDGGKARIGCTANGTDFKNLEMTSSGQMQFDGKNVVRSINNMEADASGNVSLEINAWPDYSNKINIPSGWNATQNGWIYIYHGNAYESCVTINNVPVSRGNTSLGTYDIVPISKGSVVESDTGWYGVATLYFIPPKA